MVDVSPKTGLKDVTLANTGADPMMVVGYRLAPVGHVGASVSLSQVEWEAALHKFGDPTGKSNLTITYLSPAEAHTGGSGVTVTTTATGAELTELHTAGAVHADFVKLHALGATVANAAAAGAHLAALKVNYTTGDLDAEAEIIAALNTTNTRLNAVVAELQTFGVFASS